jgi:uncharacterized protein (DUF1800 family)
MPTPAADVAHLLRRSGFSAPSTRVTELSALPLADIVDWVLDPMRADGPLVVPQLNDPALSQWEKYVAYLHAWYDRLAGANSPITEKMTIFWHNHFVSSSDKASHTAMFSQLALYRANALGNLPALTQAMALEPAMLIYLDNASNTKTGPQQNFARELMELFTMGIGNYTELDVIEVARAWTGYGIDWKTEKFLYRGDRHDNDLKTIFGVRKNWTGPDVIDAIFAMPDQRLATARFIVTKLWTYFAHPNPSETIVSQLAQVLMAANFEIRPLLRALFLRSDFYTDTAKQGLVRSPVEYIVATMHALRINADDLHPEWFHSQMGQELTSPPSVAGWKWNEYWLSTSALKTRGDFATHVHWKLGDLSRHPLGAISELAWNEPWPTPASAVTTLLTAMDVTVSAGTRLTLENFITNSRANNRHWNEDMALVLLLLCPEFNLA